MPVSHPGAGGQPRPHLDFQQAEQGAMLSPDGMRIGINLTAERSGL